jgi:C4-dicarboxylate-specific signal transduction histidine kinase
VARPLREQFLLATLVLLIPVGAVMTWAWQGTYFAQIEQLDGEANRLASAIAEHIARTGPDGGTKAALEAYLASVNLIDGTDVSILQFKDGPLLAQHHRGVRAQTEPARARVQVSGRTWMVHVGIPTQVALARAAPIFERTLLITSAATLTLLLLEFLFLGRLLPALKRFEATADRVGGGDLTTPAQIRMPSRELEHLQTVFGDMVEKLRTAREAIARQVEEERRMRLEVESLQQQVIRQERLAAIGVLLSGIAHELNNPLQAISGFSEILQRERSLDPQVKSDLALIQKESARASGIIRNLSRFSRQQSSKPTPVMLDDVVASVVELRQRRLQEQGINLQIEEAATRPAQAVFTELQQVLLNFVINAEQSINASGARADRRIIVRTRDNDAGVHFEVEDTGPGVPPEDESKLFQPFFTTKPVGEGTGLGLSVSYGIVRSFGGVIGYERGEQGGARFFVDLPTSSAPAA